jgi:hypothetical protein
MLKLMQKNKQAFITILLGALMLIAFGVFWLITHDSSATEATRLKDRADRYFDSLDFIRALNFYEMALEADPGYAEVYKILLGYHDAAEDREAVWDILVRATTHTNDAVLLERYRTADYPVQFPCEELHRQVWNQMYRDEYDNIGLIWKNDLAAEEFLHTRTFDGEFTASFSQPLIYSHFYLSDLTLDNLDFLRYFESLTVLGILRCDIADVSYLANMTNLTTLSLTGHYYDFIIDDDVFESFWDSSMERLPLDLSLFSGMISLELINITGYIISDISPLTELENLESIHLQSCEITDISPFAGKLRRQMFFDFSHNNITDISTLDDWQLAFVRNMSLYGNPIEDTSPAERFGNRITFNPPLFEIIRRD